VTGERATFTNWEQRNPNSMSGAEHVGAVLPTEGSNWHDALSAVRTFGFICEWD
jgi:hypothetical protein